MQQWLMVTDIFGCCMGSERLQQDLAQANIAVQIVDPFQGKVQQFSDEEQAYAAYSSRCGHDAYAAIAALVLQNSAQPFDVAIGFSAGATALWRALVDTHRQQIKQAILFYPGQIHQHLALEPQIPTQIIFGRSEPHFSVADICQQLQTKPGVNAQHTHFAHGFMNPASNAFHEQGYQQYARLVMQALSCNVAAEPATRQRRRAAKDIDRTLLAYIKQPSAEAGYIDVVTASKNGLSYIYQGERWARKMPAFCSGKCRNSKGEEIEISPLSRHYSVKEEAALMVTEAAKQRYQLWLMKKLKQSRESSKSGG